MTPGERASDFIERVAHALHAGGSHAVGVVVVELDQPWAGVASDDEDVALLDERTVVALERSGGERQARARAQRLIEATRDPGAHAGVAVGVGPGVDAAQLLDDARLAARQARERDADAIVMFDPPMRRRLAERQALADDLRRAVAGEQLRLAYQPIVSLVDGRVVAAEALLRWAHPERGAVPAGEFLGIAAEERLAQPIGRWVLREAVAQLVRWDAAGGARLGYLAVNVFAEQLRDGRLAHELEGVLRDAGCDPGRIALEITEHAAGDSPVALATIEQLHALGVRLLLDDFGTGASSLRSLRRLAVDGVKIDRSFVAGLSDDAHDRHIAAAIVGMAGSLGIDVIAEGVETADQARWLRRLGCAVAQGFAFARPARPEDLPPMLASGLAGGAAAAAFGPVQEPAAVRPAPQPWVRGEDELITLGEAAQLLDISASTARRWADGGQLRVIRTSGGHRRFDRADVERLAGGSGAVPVVRRPAAFPPAAPAVARVLADDGNDLAAAAGRAVYEEGAGGWLAGEHARSVLDRFALELAAAVRAGDAADADAAVRRLLDDAREAGVALVEADAFLSRYFLLAARTLRRAGAADAELVVARALAAIARHVLLQHAEGR